MLEPWIIEEILKREREERERREKERRIEVPKEEQGERREKPDRRDGPEMPADRRPGHDMPAPQPEGHPTDEPKRGVDISRITGNDDDEGSIRQIDIPKDVPAPKEPGSEKKTPVRKPD